LRRRQSAGFVNPAPWSMLPWAWPNRQKPQGTRLRGNQVRCWRNPPAAATAPGETAPREEMLPRSPRPACRLPALTGVALVFALGTARAQSPQAAWLDPALLAAAKAEGALTVYSSTNEQEGLPLFKLFTDATGIKVEYVRASDSQLTARMMIEFRADQKSYDIVHMTTVNKLPPQMLAQVDPLEAKNI